MLRLLKVSVWILILLTVASAAWVLLQTLQAEVGDAARIARVQQLLRDAGVLAPVAYVLFVTAEVIVAPLPGLLLYIPGGLLFGPVLGGTLALIGNILGAGIACSLARRLGCGCCRAWIPMELLRDCRPGCSSTDSGWCCCCG